MDKESQKKVFVVFALLMLIALAVVGSECSAVDPCVGQRTQCYNSCPTVVIAKQVCQAKCDYDYDRCEGKPV
jgi:hypothetical protein